MKKFFIPFAAIMLSVTVVSAQPASDFDKYVEVIQKVCDEASDARYAFDYAKAEQYTRQAITVFDTQPREFQETHRSLKGELCYDLARYCALQGKTEDALNALEEAVNLGWDNYSFAKNDSDLNNIRRTKRFKAMMPSTKS